MMNKHVPVLFNEVLEHLALSKADVVADFTLGRAGHASAFLPKVPAGFLYGFDHDEDAIIYSAAKLQSVGQNFRLFHTNFINAKTKLAEVGVNAVDKIFIDLGVSSPQFDEAERGFSYRYDGPLDMRMDRTLQKLTAADIVNKWDENDLATLFFKYAEHPESRRVASGIVRARQSKYIATTGQLVEIIRASLSNKTLRKQGHPAKTFFQALRIAVNDELTNLEKMLADALMLLAPGGRLAIITFHSLEDRIVKNYFKEVTTKAKGHPSVPDTAIPEPPYVLITRKVVQPSAVEINTNPRSKSAKLRVIQRRE